jgi:hypothetical protein
MARMFHFSNGRINFEPLTLDNHDLAIAGKDGFDWLDPLPAEVQRPSPAIMKAMLRRDETLRLSPEIERAYAENTHENSRYD